MKRITKIIMILLVLGIGAALYVWFFVYNKPHKDYANMKPDVEISAESLFNEYRTNPDRANELYTGKLIQITTNPHKVERLDSLVVAVWIFERGMFGDEGVRLTMLDEFEKQMSEIYLASDFDVKGFCTGYNDTDVILEKGSVETGD